MSNNKSKCPRQSASLHQKRFAKGLADFLFQDSQPDQNEPLVVGHSITPCFSASYGFFYDAAISVLIKEKFRIFEILLYLL